ncbi:hypothetical protein [Microseira sp. BLCC-F43]|jgi:hypothetical protein|uniref:hypothetical protein n=1 Tax=Microseira sp. BLCC-F43 TaxID=3153602 RepID=UPI0035B9CA52
MKDQLGEDKIKLILLDIEKVSKALAQAVENGLVKHKKASNPVAVWWDGKVVWIPPAEIPVTENTPSPK